MKPIINGRTRIKDIAMKAGVSTGTVDRVLHNRGEVSEATREHVLNIIKELDYTPNILAKSLASKKVYSIAALIPAAGDNNQYWEKPLAGFEQALSEIRDYNTNVLINTYDIDSSSSLAKAFRALLKEKPDGLVFAPFFSDTAVEIAGECEEKNIPYIFIDRNIEGLNNLAFFGQNGEHSGFLAARIMHYGVPDKSNVLVIKPGSSNASQQTDNREKGFLKFFNSSANTRQINTIAVDVNVPVDDLPEKLDVILKDIKGIFITNSRAYKVAEYLEKRSMQDVVLIGYDLIDKNICCLEKGNIDFLIGQKPEEQGYKSVMALFNYLINRREVEKINYSPIDIIMRENIDYYKNLNFIK